MCVAEIGPKGDVLWVRVCTLSCFSCVQLCNSVNCSPPGSSVHGILQARIVKWIVMPSSGGFSWPRDRTHISCIPWVLIPNWSRTICLKKKKKESMNLLLSFSFSPALPLPSVWYFPTLCHSNPALAPSKPWLTFKSLELAKQEISDSSSVVLFPLNLRLFLTTVKVEMAGMGWFPDKSSGQLAVTSNWRKRLRGRMLGQERHWGQAGIWRSELSSNFTSPCGCYLPCA